MWQWPKSFIEINLRRLEELGRVSAPWAEKVLRGFAESEASDNAWFTTPLFLEIVARRE